MKNVLFATIFICTIAILACSKDSVNTRPSLTLKSFNPEIIAANSNAQVKFTFGDKEGDLDSLIIYKIRLNKRTTPTTRDSLKFSVPDIEKNTSGDVIVDLTYQNHLISATNPPTTGTPPRREWDTLTFKFVLRDKAKNVSDTVVVSPIIVVRQ